MSTPRKSARARKPTLDASDIFRFRGFDYADDNDNDNYNGVYEYGSDDVEVLDESRAETSGSSSEYDNEVDFTNIDDLDNVNDNEERNHTPDTTPRMHRNTTRSKPSTYQQTKSQGQIAHVRGVKNPHHHASKIEHNKTTFGTGKSELLAMIAVRETWSGGRDTTLPLKETIREWKKVRQGVEFGEGVDFGVAKEKILAEMGQGWDWLYEEEGRGRRFRERQVIVPIDKDREWRKYLPGGADRGKHTVFMGPTGKQQNYDIRLGESMNFGTVWPAGLREEYGKALPNKRKLDKGKPPNTEASGNLPPIREGWLLYLGEKIKWLGWAPNNNRTTQYLALALQSTEEQRSSVPDGPEGSPAFTPDAPFPASIQIWAFESLLDGEEVRKIDMSIKPQLKKVIGTNWGEIKQLTWCHIPRDIRDQDLNDGHVRLGLLAGVWGDGYAKVLDIWVDGRRESGTEYVKIANPAFAACAPTSVTTCLQFLSPTDLVTGNAHGYISVYNILNSPPTNPTVSTTVSPSPTPSPRPYIHIPLCSTYIVSLETAYPSFPTYISVVSLDGSIRLLDLKTTPICHAPVSSITSVRNRITQTTLIYSPFLRAFISPDENAFIRLLPIRRFFSSIAAARHTATVSSLSSGRAAHPSILIGGLNGEVSVCSPLRKMLYYKEKVYSQTWFTHEWVQKPSTKTSTNSTDSKPLPPTSGTSHIHDGFAATLATTTRPNNYSTAKRLSLATPRPLQKQTPVPTPAAQSSSSHTAKSYTTAPAKLIANQYVETVWEERSAVTAVDWNPNIDCAGWAAAGMACGLLRVEDLGC